MRGVSDHGNLSFISSYKIGYLCHVYVYVIMQVYIVKGLRSSPFFDSYRASAAFCSEQQPSHRHWAPGCPPRECADRLTRGASSF